MNYPKSFASDNFSGIHPEILRAIEAANIGHAKAYGDDPWTQRAIEKFQEHLGEGIEVYFLFGGTATNVIGLSHLLRSYEAVICADSAHIHVNECGASEKFIGCKLLTCPTSDGKLTINHIKSHLHGLGNAHHVQPKVVSITQATELGTVYTPREIQELADFVHQHNMLLHMDGARISNAAASLGVKLREITTDVGLDLLSFGGTKNGLMCGEAVVFFNLEKAKDFKFACKQGMQVASKMRFIAAQFEAFLSNDLWLKNAEHANKMARLLARKMSQLSQIRITQRVESNQIFAQIPPQIIARLQEKFFFYVWNEQTSEVRWVTSFDTNPEDVEEFAENLEQSLEGVSSGFSFTRYLKNIVRRIFR